jgi:HEPN domain-containing protein
MAGTASDDWLARAQNDLAAAQTMLATGQRLYLQIGLQCHGAIQKLLTASYAKHHGATPAPTDSSISRLLADLPWRADLDARMLQTIEWLDMYPILESMNPPDQGDLAALLTDEKTTDLLARTRELFAWLAAKLSPGTSGR